MEERKAELKSGARLTLFLVSYLPLFFIMIFSQIYKYKSYLNWGGLNFDAFVNFIVYFGAVSVLVCMLFLVLSVYIFY